MSRKKPSTGSSESIFGDARYAWHSGARLSRDSSWLRRKEHGEVWPRFVAEIPPELAEEIDAVMKKVAGVNQSAAVRSNAVRAGLRLWLEHHSPAPQEAIEGTADVIDGTALELEAPDHV